ncbi:hypothetical protein OG693_39930 [Streptomyces sp. NBC_01259]|uniref:hypothetical protein n=1 Tax=Streptomyces sp. NBC_01259 TaxID=2903800 RepID=UPI00324F1251
MPSTMPPLPPAAVAALTAAEVAGEQARAALRAHETAGNTPDGEPAPDAQTARDLAFAGDAEIDDVLAALYSLTARVTAHPQTAGQWEKVQHLARWIGDAAGAHVEDHQDDADESAGTSAAPAAPGRITPQRIAQIRRQAQSEHRTHAWADDVIEELLTAAESPREASPAELSHAMLIAVLMDAGGSLELPADAFTTDALGGYDGSFHAVGMDALSTGRVRLSVQPRPDVDGAGIHRA